MPLKSLLLVTQNRGCVGQERTVQSQVSCGDSWGSRRGHVQHLYYSDVEDSRHSVCVDR